MKGFVLLVVPAIIGLSMVGSAIYITMYNPTQTIPQFMVDSMTTILGYYFGHAAAAA
jgi:hypothetical protein